MRPSITLSRCCFIFTICALLAIPDVDARAENNVIELVATKKDDAKLVLKEDVTFAIPDEIEIVSGSALKAKADFHFRALAPKSKAHHCIYNGKVLGFWAKLWSKLTGKSRDSILVLDKCNHSLKSESEAVGGSFHLKLHSMMAPLKVKLVLKVAGSAEPTPTATPTHTPNPTPTATPQPTPTATPDPGENLPPDPGAAGKETIEGIDSDGDGIRDDLQRWIYFNIPETHNNEQMRKGWETFALASQNTARPYTDQEKAIEAGKNVMRAYRCLIGRKLIQLGLDPNNLRERALYPGMSNLRDEISDLTDELHLKVTNTKARTRAYFERNAQAGGYGLRTSDVSEEICDKLHKEMKND